jgi:hypothetical protein
MSPFHRDEALTAIEASIAAALAELPALDETAPVASLPAWATALAQLDARLAGWSERVQAAEAAVTATAAALAEPAQAVAEWRAAVAALRAPLANPPRRAVS